MGLETPSFGRSTVGDFNRLMNDLPLHEPSRSPGRSMIHEDGNRSVEVVLLAVTLDGLHRRGFRNGIGVRAFQGRLRRDAFRGGCLMIHAIARSRENQSRRRSNASHRLEQAERAGGVDLERIDRAPPCLVDVAHPGQMKDPIGHRGFECRADRRFVKQVEETKRSLLEFLIQAKREGKTVVGYGAAAKGNTLLNYCGIRSDFLDYTVDLNPHKQGHFLPGTRIPIYAREKIRETKPDYVLILPWNLKDEITSQMAHIREWGGRFVVPIPKVEVLP